MHSYGRRKRMKTWKKPKLIVLVRSRPEEAVLNNCKQELVTGAGGTLDKCYEYFAGVPPYCAWQCVYWYTS